MWFEEERISFDSSSGIYKVHGKIMKPLNLEIKGIIQKEGSCFSTSVITSMQGVNENGNPIKVNNLSKYPSTI